MIYVIDSGIEASHYEFTNWPASAGRVFVGPDFVGGNGGDCNGHGTHVAGIAAGNTYGVAKRAFITSVRVFPCTQNSPVSTIVAGVNWVINTNGYSRAIANLSFGGSPNQAIDDAVRNLVASGITSVIAAGNDNVNANNYSPARVREAITVANSDVNDIRDSVSNYGTAVDLYAPGNNITAAGLSNTLAVKSGTSMSAPHVSGAIALHLESGWPMGESPAITQNKVVSNASLGKISNLGSESPNHLLYVGSYNYGNFFLPFFRHKNFATNSNLYVMGWNELGGGNFGYLLQETEGYISLFDDGYTTGPLYRYRSASTNDYIYTMNWAELGNGANGYIFEKIEGYLRFDPNSSTIPLYRYWNPTIQKHYYTSDFSEIGNGSNGYVFEGVTGYLWTS